MGAEHHTRVGLREDHGLRILHGRPALQGVDLALVGDPAGAGLVAEAIRAVVKRLDIGRMLG